MLKSLTLILLSTIFCLLTSSCTPTFKVALGSETKLLHETKDGTAIAPMQSVTVKAMRKQEDGTIKVVPVTINQYTVIRVGIYCAFKDVDVILTQEEVVFDAMTPDKKVEGQETKLSLSRTTIPALTGIKIGSTTWQPPANTTTAEPAPETPK